LLLYNRVNISLRRFLIRWVVPAFSVPLLCSLCNVEGVVRGRIPALTEPMIETEQSAHDNVDHSVDGLVDILHEAQLQADDEKDLAGLMMRCLCYALR
jgi:hypothetical protein